MDKFKIATPIVLVCIYTGMILLSTTLLKKNVLFFVSKNEFINFQINYQFCLVIITLFSLASTFFLNKENFANYFSVGNIAATCQELKIFGIKKDDSWLKTGLSLSISISLATAGFMYLQLKKAEVDWSLLENGIFWILLFSFTNSFGEEIIYRVGVVSPLRGLLSPITIFTISAILFGIPHLAGMPGGIIGAMMAGLLGLVLAKSLYETNGLFWAWTIHFLQDVIIFSALYLLTAKPTN